MSNSDFARLGSATVYEAASRRGLVDVPWRQIIPGSRVAGPARTVRCAQGDNLMVHAAMASLEPGDVLVLTMPEPAPVALVGDLMATQARVQGAAAILVDAAVRDVSDLIAIGLPIWTRYVSIRGPLRVTPGTIGEAVTVGGTTIETGDVLVLDADGVVAVARDRVDEVLAAALARERGEAALRVRLLAGERTYDLDRLHELVAPVTPPRDP